MSLRKIAQKSTAAFLALACAGLPSVPGFPGAFAAENSAYAAVPAQGSEQWMVGVYQEGKRFFEMGDYDAAQREWDKLSGSYDKNPSLKVIVDFMRSRIKSDPETIQRGRKFQEQKSKEYEKQAKAAQKPPAAPSKKAREHDARVSQFLGQAHQDVTRQNREIERKPTMDARRAQKQMLAAFTQGKTAYLAGDLRAAIAAWEEAVSYLPADAPARRQFAELKSNSLRVAEKRRLVDPSEVAPAPVATPADMKDFLELVNARFRAEAQEGKARTAQRSTAAVDRQSAVDKSFQKSKLLYFQGEYEQAIDELNALAKYFSPASEEAHLIAGLRENYLEAYQAQEEARRIQPSGAARVESPAELRSFVDQAARKFDAMVEEARALRASSEKTAGQRTEFVQSAIKRSRSYLDQGRIEEALSELERIAPYVENEAEILGLVDEVRARRAEAEREREALEGPDSGDSKVKRAATKGVGDFLKDAARRIREESQKLAAQRKDADASTREKNRRLADIFQNARSRYDAGDTDGALDLLERMAPDVEDGAEVDRTIAELRAELEQTRKDSGEIRVLQAKAKKYPMPADLSQLLSETGENIRSHARELRQKRETLSRTAAEQQRQFTEAYEAGRAAYNAGNLDTALREWESLVPIVENGEELSHYLADVKRDYQAALEAENASRAADAPEKVRLPDDFYELMNQTAAQARSRAQAAVAQKQTVESTVAERQNAITRAYEAGRGAYNAGDLEKAITEWQALVPMVEDGAQLGALLDSVRRDYRAAAQAIETAESAEKSVRSQFQAPSEVSKLLSGAQKQIETRGREARAKKETLERDSGERRAAFERAVQEGRSAYQAGDLNGALAAWEKLVPMVEDGQALGRRISTVRSEFQTAHAAKTEADAFGKESPLQTPSEITAALSELSKKFKADIAQSDELKATAEKRSAERRKRVETAISEGMAFYKKGLMADAAARWESILPDVEDGDRLKKLLTDLKQAESAFAATQKTALDAEAASKAPIPAGELAGALDAAFSSAKKKLDEAQERERAANAEAVRRQKAAAESIQNGKLALARGEVDAAADAWAQAAPLLEGGATLAPKLQELKGAYAQAAQAQQLAAAAEEASLRKFQSLPEIDAFITEANLKYKNDLAAANLRKEQADAAYAEKRALVDHTVRRARASFEQGDIPGATVEAQKILPLMEEPMALHAQISGIQKAYDDTLEAQNEATAAEIRTNRTLFKTPPELPLLLKDAELKIKELAQLAQTQKLEAEQALKDKEAFVQRAFERGKNMYWQGKLDQALAEWDNMAPLLEDGSKIKEVTGRYEETLHIQRQAREWNARKDEKFRTPEELQRLLNDAEKILESQSSFAVAKQKSAQDQLTDRQEFVNRQFQKGKALYEQGMIPDAIEEWEKLTPVLENGSKVKEFIDGVKANYRGTLEEQKDAERAEARSIVQPQAPADLTRLLSEANEGLKVETQRAREEREKAEQALREKQKMVEGIFQKGKLFYEAGRLEEAIDTWKTLLPFVDDNTSIRQLIEQAEDSRRQLLAERYEAQNPKAVSAPNAMQFALEETNAALKDQVSREQSARIEADLKALVGTPAPTSKPKALPLSSMASGAGQVVDEPPAPFKIDEIEQMMLEYKVVTPEELKKRREELKAASAKSS